MKVHIEFNLDVEIDKLKYNLLNNIENIMADFDDYWLQLSFLTGEYVQEKDSNLEPEFIHKKTINTNDLLELLNDANMPEGVRDLYYGWKALRMLREAK